MHLVTYADQDKIFSWGWPEYGQLCRASKSPAAPLRIEDGFKGQAVTLVAAGLAHSLIAIKNSVFSCGNNIMGQLGTGNLTNQDKPTKLVSLEHQNVIQLAAGCEHSLALMGELFVVFNFIYFC
jgi:alpha-tubulin suppressor-like RCC1 family protein